MSLAQAVIDVDAALEGAAEEASIELYRHRWYWTLNPENPERISSEKYGKAVGRAKTTIRLHAKSYAQWLKDDSKSLSEYAVRANSSEERSLVIERVADAHGVSFKTVASTREYHDDVSNLLEQAKNKAAKTGEELPMAITAVCDFYVKGVEQRKREVLRFREQHGVRFAGVENDLTAARNAVQKALHVAMQIDWTDQESLILAESIRKLVALTQLIDMAVTGTIEVDWDAEMAKLGVA